MPKAGDKISHADMRWAEFRKSPEFMLWVREIKRLKEAELRKPLSRKKRIQR